jgi:magnesium chelatase family protein
LFLDEFPEFPRYILESLRQPIENKSIVISRVGRSINFPCNFILLTAANPCPCGNLGSSTKKCNCSPISVKKYSEKLSGPMEDRIDLHVYCYPVELIDLSSAKEPESSLIIKRRVQIARNTQLKRYKMLKFRKNSDLTNSEIKSYIRVDKDGLEFLNEAGEKLNLSARSYFKTIKIARTIADISQTEIVSTIHIAEALQYRKAGF